MSFIENLQYGVVDRLHRAGDQQAAGIAQTREMLLIFEQMFDLDGHIIGHFREFPVQGVYDRQHMPGTVEEIRIAEGDMLCAHLHLLADICQHHFFLHHPEAAVIDRHNRAMAAGMLTAAGSFHVAGDPGGAVAEVHLCITA